MMASFTRLPPCLQHSSLLEVTLLSEQGLSSLSSDMHGQDAPSNTYLCSQLCAWHCMSMLCGSCRCIANKQQPRPLIHMVLADKQFSQQAMPFRNSGRFVKRPYLRVACRAAVQASSMPALPRCKVASGSCTSSMPAPCLAVMRATAFFTCTAHTDCISSTPHAAFRGYTRREMTIFVFIISIEQCGATKEARGSCMSSPMPGWQACHWSLLHCMPKLHQCCCTPYSLWWEHHTSRWQVMIRADMTQGLHKP